MDATAGEGPQNQATPAWLVAYLNRQGDWLEKTRGNLVVAATVIATMSFQLMSNPPGGVWETHNCSYGDKTNTTCKGTAGTSVLEHEDSKRPYYVAMIISSDMSFTASMILMILLVISGFRLKESVDNGYDGDALELVHNDDPLISSIGLQHFRFRILFSVAVLLSQLVWFLWWLIRKICCCRQSTPRLLPLTSSPAP